ncbi:uncharacterized protein JCM15063_000478 [Sporobolomyces koalae]|uniref:uncharacterized protein n=1 Tax=Sporobolomyces koalae TaxID=500713 RepID=UPI00317A1A15
MFYSPQLLTSRKGGFAVVWLAASLGVKGGGSGKRLSRKQLLACDLVKAWCALASLLPLTLSRELTKGSRASPASRIATYRNSEALASPAEPLALRLSSTLLSGIARVYQQQCLFFSNDVTQVHQALKKAFTDALASSTDRSVEIDLAPTIDPAAVRPKRSKAAAATARITLVRDPIVAVYGFDPDDEIDSGVWYFPGGQDEHEREKTPAFEIEGASVIEFERSPAFFEVSPRRLTGAFQAKPADITLEEPHVHDYLLEPYGGVARDFGTGEQLELGIFGEGERGLLEGQIPELDAALRASTAGFQSGAQASTSAGQQEGDYEGDFFAGRDFGGAIEDEFGGMGDMQFDDVDETQGIAVGGEGEETFEARAAREHAEGLLARQGALPQPRPSSPGRVSELAKDLSETPSTATRKRVSDVLEHFEHAPQVVKKQKKLKGISIDRSTELSDNAFRTSRATYNERMLNEREKLDKARNDRQQSYTILLLNHNFVAVQAPGLSDFWKESLASQMVPYDGGKAVDAKKRFAQAMPERQPLRPITPSPFRQGRSPAAVELGREAFGGPSPAHHEEYDEGDFFAGRDFGGELAPEGGESPNFLDRALYPEPQEIELGRGLSPGGAASSTRPSLAPWHAEPDLEQGERRSRTPSLHPPSGGRPSSVGGFDMQGFDFGTPEQAGHVEEGRLSRASSLVSPGIASGDLAANLEQESRKFLVYIQRIASTIPTPSPPNEKPSLTFGDLVPIDQTTVSTAAQAMYHTLSLTMKGVLKVKQDTAYGPIEIEVRDAGM